VTIIGPKRYLDRIRQAEKLNLFLDYDGTLANFAPTPDEIYPDPDLIELLGQITQSKKFQVFVISGRRLTHIQKLIPLSGILLAGTYGIEILLPNGKQIDRVQFQKTRPILNEIKPKWLELIKHHSNIYLEDKRWSLALHAKDVEDFTAENILSQARNFLSDIPGLSTDFRILGGHKFLEIAPLLANKGITVEYLLNQQHNHALPVYIGDDDKDEEAFEKIVANQGVAIKVCRQKCKTIAQLRITGPQKVRQFLESLLQLGT
jgi:trehalose-phosphatase